jgi:outer membrane murein-binding lipoprotein Lpp
MNTRTARLAQIQARWDARAVEQLRAEVARLAAENERLEAELYRAEGRAASAEEWAESWRDDFYRACETNGAQPGITMDGHLVAVPANDSPTTPITEDDA